MNCGHYMSGCSLSALSSHGQDRLNQSWPYNAYSKPRALQFDIKYWGGGGQRGPLLDEFIKGWTYNLYIIDRVVPKYSEVMCFTCFNVDYT